MSFAANRIPPQGSLRCGLPIPPAPTRLTERVKIADPKTRILTEEKNKRRSRSVDGRDRLELPSMNEPRRSTWDSTTRPPSRISPKKDALKTMFKLERRSVMRPSNRSRCAISRSESPRIISNMNCPLQLFSESHELEVGIHSELKLASVSGFGASTARSLAVDPIGGQTAYLAGSTVVISKNGRQAHLISTNRNTFSAVAFSPCGRYLATGEAGHDPAVRVWAVCDDDGKFDGRELHSLKGHSFEIVAVEFGDGGLPRLVSVGNQHDHTMCVWDWRRGELVTTSKISSIVSSVSMCPDGSTFTTAGSKHVKIWNMMQNKLHGRSAILGDKRNCNFSSGLYVNENRYLAVADSLFIIELVDKKVTQTYRYGNKKIFALAIMGNHLLVGMENGELNACQLNDLTRIDFVFPYPHYLGLDVAEAVESTALFEENHPPDAIYPDIRSIAVHPHSETVSVIYSDRSIYMFKHRGSKVVDKVYSDIGHVGAVHVIEPYPSNRRYLPAGTFVTGGSDGTVRFWNQSKEGSDGIQTTMLPMNNVYSDSLKKIVFTNTDPNVICDATESTSIVPTARLDSSTDVRSLRFSPDGRHLAIGMKNGNFLILDVVEMGFVQDVDAHDSDVFVVEYNDPSHGGPSLFATGGRDRVVHLFTPHNGYQHCATFADHQSGVIGIKFAQKFWATEGFRMFTMGTDKIIVIWEYNKNSPSLFQRINQISCTVSFTDLILTADLSHLMVGCSDRQIRIYNFSGKPVQSINGSSDKTSSGNLSISKICIDPSGTLAATICDKMVHIVDIRSQRVLAVLPGSGETPLSVCFSVDMRNVIVCAVNGCIYTWRLSSRLHNRLQQNARELADRMIRIPSPDSLLGSGSDCISEEHQLPALERSSDIDSTSGGGSSFGSVDSINLDHPAHHTFTVEVPESRGLEVERRQEGVVRKSNSNLHADSTTILDSIQTPSPTSEERPTRQYTASKSMSNLRGPLMMDQVHRENSPRRPRKKWNLDGPGEDIDIAGSTKSSTLLQGLLDQGRHNENIYAAPNSQYGMQSGVNSPYSATSLSMQRGFGSPLASSSPLRNVIKSPFNRSDSGRISLTKSFHSRAIQGLHGINNDPKPQTVWSPTQLSQSRRSMSSVQYANPANTNSNGAVASAITRRQSAAFIRPGSTASGAGAERAGASTEKIRRARTFGRLKDIKGQSPTSPIPQGLPGQVQNKTSQKADDYASSPLHLRSRSQSPNQLIQNGALRCRRDSDMSYTSNGLSLSSRLTSSRTNLNQPEGMRKSNQTLDKLSQMRSKLRQSTENIMAPQEDNFEDSMSSTGSVSRSKSIGNLRNGGAPLEAFGTFDADQGAPRASRSNSSLSQSRMLARSMGNISNTDDGSQTNPANKLAHTIQLLKKASNPDLTQSDQYDDTGSFQERLINRRGAVQKRVDRYHPRNRTAGRTGTSEESDSNTSEVQGSPIGIQSTRRYFGGAANRSVSSVEGRSGLGQRRLFENSRHGSNVGTATRRNTNYLAQKLAGEEAGPDLGSDESARGGSSNSAEFITKFDTKPNADKNMALHVDQVIEEAFTYVDKALCASKLSRESEVSFESRELLNQRMVKALQQMNLKINSELQKYERRYTEDSLHDNVYHATSAPVAPTTQVPEIDMNFLSRHGHELMEMLKQNMAKQN